MNEVYGKNQGCNEYEYITYCNHALESDQDNLNDENFQNDFKYLKLFW